MIGNWAPAKGTHAISVAAISIRFGQPLTDITWSRALTLAEAAAVGLGLSHREPVQSVMVALTPGTAQSINNEEVGFVFNRDERAARTSTTLTVLRDSLKVEEWSYTRWAAMRASAVSSLTQLLDPYLTSVPLSGVSVEYVDQFQTPPGDAFGDAAQIIDSGSPMISKKAFNRHRPWHSYCGWFDVHDEEIRRLHQCNVDIGDATSPDGPFKGIQIRTMLNDQFNQAGLKPLRTDRQTADFLFASADELHDLSKTDLARVLTKDARNAISL